MKQKLLKTLVLLCALIVGSATSWADTATITFGNADGSTSINEASVTGDDSQGNKWTITTVGTTSFTPNASYAQVGSSKKPATSITFTTTLANDVNVTSFSAKFGGFSGTAGTVTLKVGDTTVGSGSLDKTADVTVTSSSAQTGKTLTVTVTGISKGVKCYYISYTYTSGSSDPVAVTGVSLDPTELDLTVGGNATLTATVAPADATDKVVTWSSSDEDVATVDNGVVTAVAVGTATITVTTEDGDKTASCEVTVTAAPAIAITLDFETNILGLPVNSANKATASTGYTYGGYTYTLAAADGYYYNSDKYVMLGKSGSTLTFPAFPFNVSKIKVYGTSTASGSVVQNIYVDETAVSTATTGAKDVVNEYEIASGYQAAGNVYVLKVTSNHNTQISKIEIIGYEPVTVSAVGFATLFTPVALDFSGVTGLIAYTAVKDGNVVRLTQVDDVPANTGVVLEGAAGTYSIPAIATSSTAKGELRGNATKATAWNAESGITYYVLASTGSGVEFSPVTTGEIAAGKAFLKVAGGSVHAFNVVFGDETGISEVVRGGEKESAIFDLSGRRVAKPAKGLYIVNGKKILVK